MVTDRVSATTSPKQVTVEALPGGRVRVILTRGVREVETDEGAIYEYSEAVFDLPDDRSAETEESIGQAFSSWWAYAEEDHTPLTQDEKIELLFDAVFGEEEE